MTAHIILYKYTQKGLADIKGSPERIKQGRALAERLGSRLIGVWVTLGEYDLVAIVEGPDDQTAAVGVLTQAMGGTVTTTTLRAFSEDEFAQIVSRLP